MSNFQKVEDVKMPEKINKGSMCITFNNKKQPLTVKNPIFVQ